MSLTLMHTNRNIDENAVNKRNWQAITAVAEHGVVRIEASTVSEIARLLEDATLTNGTPVSAYPNDDDDFHGSLVCAFGPSLLGENSFRQTRTILEEDANGEKATELFDLVVALEIQVTFGGDSLRGFYIKGVNWIADDVTINRTSGRMYAMLSDIGLGQHLDTAAECGEVDFETFEKAVNDNMPSTDVRERLQQFVAGAKRNGATHVYWA